jgi:hypothetical protein
LVDLIGNPTRKWAKQRDKRCKSLGNSTLS